MSKRATTSSLSPAARFIARRIYELRGRRSQSEIATLAGFTSVNMLSMIKDGKAKLPVERAFGLAKALECDAGMLIKLALEQTLTRAVIEQVFAPPSTPLTPNEEAIIAKVRASSGGVPVLTPELGRDLDRVFSRPKAKQPDFAIWAAVLTVQVRLAQHDLKTAKQFLSAVTSRVDRVGTNLAAVSTALEEMMADAKQA